MKIPLPILLLIVLSIPVQGQTLTENDIIGNWKTVSSIYIADTSETKLDQEQQMKMEREVRELMDTEFTFDSDNNFRIELSDEIPDFMKKLESFENKKWRFDPEKLLISIGVGDKYNLMDIYIKIHKGATIFAVDETPFAFIVNRN